MIPRSPHQLTPNVKLLQKIVLCWEDKVLVVQRDAASFSRPGSWDFPGGNSEWPENISAPTSNLHQHDASREVWEETGVRLEPTEFIRDRLIYLETFFDPEKEIFTMLLGWKIALPPKFDPNSVRLSEEHVAFRWIKPVDALSLDFGGVKGAFLVRILNSSL